MGSKKVTDEKKLEKKSRQDYRRAVDKIVTNQVRAFMKEMKRQRDIFRVIAVVSVPVNVVLAILLAVFWHK